MICVGKHVKEKYRFSCILELEDKEKRKQKVLNSIQKISCKYLNKEILM